MTLVGVVLELVQYYVQLCDFHYWYLLQYVVCSIRGRARRKTDYYTTRYSCFDLIHFGLSNFIFLSD